MRNYFTNNELTDSETAKRLGIKNEPTKSNGLTCLQLEITCLTLCVRNSESLYASQAGFAPLNLTKRLEESQQASTPKAKRWI